MSAIDRRLFVAALALAACGSKNPTTSHQITNGTPDPTDTTVYALLGGNNQPFCSGVSVKNYISGELTVLTQAHCVEPGQSFSLTNCPNPSTIDASCFSIQPSATRVVSPSEDLHLSGPTVYILKPGDTYADGLYVNADLAIVYAQLSQGQGTMPPESPYDLAQPLPALNSLDGQSVRVEGFGGGSKSYTSMMAGSSWVMMDSYHVPFFSLAGLLAVLDLGTSENAASYSLGLSSAGAGQAVPGDSGGPVTLNGQLIGLAHAALSSSSTSAFHGTPPQYLAANLVSYQPLWGGNNFSSWYAFLSAVPSASDLDSAASVQSPGNGIQYLSGYCGDDSGDCSLPTADVQIGFCDTNASCAQILGQPGVCTADGQSAILAQGGDCCSQNGVDGNGNCLPAGLDGGPTCTADGQPSQANGADCCSMNGVDGNGNCVPGCVADGQPSQSNGADCCSQNGIDTAGNCAATCVADGQPSQASGSDCCSQNGVDSSGDCAPACDGGCIQTCVADGEPSQSNGSDCCSENGVDSFGDCLP